MKVYYEHDASLDVLQGKTVAVIGYGLQGSVQAMCFRDSGLSVIVGSRPGTSFEKAVADGFEVYSISDAAKRADILIILLPDELQGTIYQKQIADNLVPNNMLVFSHGFSIVYRQIIPPEWVDVVLVVPKGPGAELRRSFLADDGMPGVFGVEKNASGCAKEVGLALAKALKLTRHGCFEGTFAEETHANLFGEQVILGGLAQLVQDGFETLVENHYPSEIAYLECVRTLKAIAGLLDAGGFNFLNQSISDTAEWGEYISGPRVVPRKVKGEMKKVLVSIQKGKFAKGWVREAKAKKQHLKLFRQHIQRLLIEKIGKKVRKLFAILH